MERDGEKVCVCIHFVNIMAQHTHTHTLNQTRLYTCRSNYSIISWCINNSTTHTHTHTQRSSLIHVVHEHNNVLMSVSACNVNYPYICMYTHIPHIVYTSHIPLALSLTVFRHGCVSSAHNPEFSSI